ncbi:hypothetical protein [Peribacillus sp. SCS-155]|uniref:hypothetical protein n=1 Tax=Peribacillus sedimenti TaxID=3115297 RepID=UPI003906C568
MISTFKNWLYTHNRNNKLLWLTSTLKLIRKACKIETFYKAINPLRFKYYTLFKRYEILELEDNIANGVYKVFIKKSNNNISVVKIPRKDTIYSLNLIKSIRSNYKFSQFQETLSSLSSHKYIHKHIVNFNKIYRNGGYESNYIVGYNLKSLYDYYSEWPIDKKPFIPSELNAAIDQLIYNLELYQKEYGGLEGDWDIQNMMYDTNNKKIVNVDLEGFFLYRNNELETQLDFIKENLHGLQKAINEYNFD